MMIRVLRGMARAVFVIVVLAVLGIGGLVAITLAHFGRGLPDHQLLATYVPATGSKIYAGDGSLMTEFESEHRIITPIAKLPRMVIQAFLAAEDRDFYNHKGVDPLAIFRAGMADILRFQRGQRPIGASTITQQVVRHFLLNNEVSVSRKIREAILAYRIERALSKERILEIYLNEIYLGAGAYGAAAAADTYFQKPLDQLSLAEAALLAALPKAPNNYHPIRHAAAARARRDWVLGGMADLGWISPAQAKAAISEPLNVRLRPETLPDKNAGQQGYFTEEVRRELIGRFGEKSVYEGGLSVRTSYVPVYQQMAETAFRKGLVEYDRRHGWRGPLAHLPSGAAAQGALSGIADPPGLGNWQLAAVTAVDGTGAAIALKSGGLGRIPLDELRWARRTLEDQRVGAPVRQVRDVINPGDIMLVEPIAPMAPPAPAARPASTKGRQAVAPVVAQAVPTYGLRQIPDISGGVVVMDPKTGRVFALVGGWSFRDSQFNRATQAKRQPGSAFKPLVYVTALQNGFTPSSVIEDAPIEIPQGPGLPPWRPVNYEGSYVGSTTLEDALIHSRNLATARLATMIGLPAIAKTVQDLGVMDRMPLYYSMALGAGETTLLRLTSAYAMLDNGGHWLRSSVIDLVQDRQGRVLYQKGVNGCAACFVAGGPRSGPDTGTLYRPTGPADPSSIYLPNAGYIDNALVYKPNKRDPLVSQEADHEILAMMQGVVERGTGTAVAAVGKPLAGKTGTTSDWFDAWFVGFSPDLAAGVFVGFDDPRTLGDGETGGHVAAPIFRDFMAAALKDMPAKPFPVPASAAAVLASASTAAGRGATADPSQASNTDLASLDDDAREPNARAPAERHYGADPIPWEVRPASRDYATPATPNYAPPYWPGYATPRMPDYPPAWAPSYATPGYAAPGYAAPNYATAPPPGYATPPMPGYAAPAWAARPGRGTGGLY